MALFTPSASPAVTVKEIDLTGVVPNVQTSTGAFVGKFGWGPVGVTTLVSDETGLVSTFSSPDSTNTVDFHTAAYFLRYSNSLQVVREIDDSFAKNGLANNDTLGSLTPRVYGNLDAFDSAALDSSDGAFIAKYPGSLGNSLGVSIFGTATGETDDAATKTTAFGAWTFNDKFDGIPNTSPSIAALDGVSDEIHVVVYDKKGDITGSANTVLETFPYVSVASNAKNADGSSNYYKEILRTQSDWVYASGHFHDTGFVQDSAGDVLLSKDFANKATWHTAATKGTVKNFAASTTRGSQVDWGFTGGLNDSSGEALPKSAIVRGFTKFNDADNIEIDFLIAPFSKTNADAKTIVNDLVAIAGSSRKDCVAVASPSFDAITAGTNTAVITNNKEYTKSSYLVQDNNFLKVFDKYNDKYIKIPASSSTAGLMAATDLVAAPWFSPAGARRGRYLGVTDIALSPTKAERDALYKVGINPIANIPGEGIILYGDKTNESRPSAFDRINVRRLFLGIERAIGIAGRNVMFEFNDEFTRAEFVNIVEPFLREIQGRRGITDFKVICDETNNTSAVVARNEFIANIFIKPARSINYVTLNFVAVRTGVDFEEVVGTV
jgi:phage tail sheath protein FI